MTDLKDYLENEAGRVTVGLPPVGTMLDDARRTRRRRTIAGGAGALALVVAGAVGLGVLQDDRGQTTPGLVATAPPAPSTPAGPVAQGQWVGLNGVGIDVPTDWTAPQACGEGSSAVESRSPEAGTPCTASGAGAQVSFLSLSTHELEELTGTTVGEDGWASVDGERYRANLDCPGQANSEWCIGGVFFPEREVSVTITAWGVGGRDLIEELIETVRIVPGLDAPAPAPSNEPSGDQQIDVAGLEYTIPAAWQFREQTCGAAPSGPDVDLDALHAEFNQPCMWEWGGSTGSIRFFDLAAISSDGRAKLAETYNGYGTRSQTDGVTYASDGGQCNDADGTETCSIGLYVPDPGLDVTITTRGDGSEDLREAIESSVSLQR